jgi:hypothetical protein
MSFTNVDTGFGDRRYSFDGPDFGSLDVADVPDTSTRTACATCGKVDGTLCVACADFAFIDAVGVGNDIDRFLDSVDRVEDEPELEEDEEDEEEDDDTESEKAWVSTPGIRL